MNRRKFIRNSTIASTLFPFFNVLSSCGEYDKKRGNIFIFIQLTGGNDGLNTLIPLDKYETLIKARPNLFIPEKKILKINGNDINGLHPSLAGIKDLFDNNLISFVQGVGYENQNYSHFRSQDIWLSGSQSSNIFNTGWIARFLETKYSNYPLGFPNDKQPDPPAIKVGDMGTFLFEGENMDMSIVVDPSITNYELNTLEMNASNSNGYANTELNNIKSILKQTKLYSSSIKKALAVPFQHSQLYPKPGENLLADQLKTVVKLINGGLQSAVYHVDLKGFDTHAAQVEPNNPTKGNHANLLYQVSQALVCFWDDVTKMRKEDQINGMTFSEFGRRIVSNTAYGTDHGAAQPLMFFGKNLNPGIIGFNPQIPEKIDNTDNLDMQFDFRSVYASILKNRMGATDEVVENIFKTKQSTIEIFK